MGSAHWMHPYPKTYKHGHGRVPCQRGTPGPKKHFLYSLRPILLFASMDVSSTKMYLDTFILAKSNIGWREYLEWISVLKCPKNMWNGYDG
jgi:hypothetical protein